MSDLEDEVKVLREKNNELVQKVQHWKMTAAQRENEKLELMKEINQLRLMLSRMRSSGAVEARKLDAVLQTTSEEALSHLVQASSAFARTIELTKQYIQERQEVEAVCPRWSTLSTATPERVNKVPPLLLGGRSIQPVVQLRRTSLNTVRNHLRSPNQTRTVTERAVPMHMLQDVYIPLTRIDTSNYPIDYMETDTSRNDVNNSTEDLGLVEETNEPAMAETNNSSDEEQFDNSRILDAVTEDVEPESGEPSPQRVDNPLEGPSWLLDAPNAKRIRAAARATLEPDSTTEPLDHPPPTNQWTNENKMVFTPTVRRRKRTASPPATLPLQTDNVGARVLKVVVSKLSLQPRATPSPHGATDHWLRVLDSPERGGGGGGGGGDAATWACDADTPPPGRGRHAATRASPHADERLLTTPDLSVSEPNLEHAQPNTARENRGLNSESQESMVIGDASDVNMTSERRETGLDSDSDVSERGAELRTRRNRKPVTYKEKPLKGKLRR